MIITDAAGAGRAASASQEAVHWACLARRGMLYSECESIDHLELAPGALVTMAGRSGNEDAWYVLDGEVRFDIEAGGSQRAGRGDLVLRPAGTAAAVRNPSFDVPARLLLVAVLPPVVTDRLSRRRPALEQTAVGAAADQR